MNKTYLAKFRQGSGAMGMNAIDFYREDGEIVKHKWSMGGESFDKVNIVPTRIEGYKKIPL